jgi:hypothetical protein
MSQPSDDVSHDSAAEPKLAQVLPFERPRSELQRAVQMRALESMERQRVAQASSRPKPVRRIATFALALIPVGLLFIAVDGLLRVFHRMNDLYNSPAANSVPAPEQEEITQSEPGVVLLQPPKNLRDPEPTQRR